MRGAGEGRGVEEGTCGGQRVGRSLSAASESAGAEPKPATELNRIEQLSCHFEQRRGRQNVRKEGGGGGRGHLCISAFELCQIHFVLMKR